MMRTNFLKKEQYVITKRSAKHIYIYIYIIILLLEESNRVVFLIYKLPSEMDNIVASIKKKRELFLYIRAYNPRNA
jgi:hypothetical protein